MAYYRLYFLDPNERIRHVVEMECEDDSQAIKAVAEHDADRRVKELWNRDRLVQRFPLGEAKTAGGGA